MPDIKLKIEEILLDHDNPRIPHADGQQDALQKVISDQRGKLVALAESIIKHGLNPMDRLLVLRLNQTPERFVSLEGNRRIGVFKLLTNPAVMSGLEMPNPMKRAFEKLAKQFKKSVVEPISCFETSREEAKYWINLRHNIGHEGAGIEGWKSLAKRRAEGKAPVLQALELVMERAGLTSAERNAITEEFPTSTFERILENRAARQELGLDVDDGNLVTKLPADEIAKPLKKIVLDLARKDVRVNRLMKTEDMLHYLRTDLGKEYLPDMSKARRTKARTLTEIPVSEFTKVPTKRTRRKLDPSDRKEVVPRTCKLTVTQNRMADMFKELRTLKVDDAPNAIAVLLRVFLELSVDCCLVKNGGKLDHGTTGSGRIRWKTLDEKLAEVVALVVQIGASPSKFKAITHAVTSKASPMHTDLLHRYVHDQHQTPVPRDLMAAWDHAQPLFECIWP